MLRICDISGRHEVRDDITHHKYYVQLRGSVSSSLSLPESGNGRRSDIRECVVLLSGKAKTKADVALPTIARFQQHSENDGKCASGFCINIRCIPDFVSTHQASSEADEPRRGPHLHPRNTSRASIFLQKDTLEEHQEDAFGKSQRENFKETSKAFGCHHGC